MIKLYKIKVINMEKNTSWWEYGFSSYLMKRMTFLFHETDELNFLIFTVVAIYPLVFTWDTFKKCFIHYSTEKQEIKYDNYYE